MLELHRGYIYISSMHDFRSSKLKYNTMGLCTTHFKCVPHLSSCPAYAQGNRAGYYSQHQLRTDLRFSIHTTLCMMKTHLRTYTEPHFSIFGVHPLLFHQAWIHACLRSLITCYPGWNWRCILWHAVWKHARSWKQTICTEDFLWRLHTFT